MITISQNSASASLDQALVPGPLLVDGRTEEDFLTFLSEYASLIYFYDQNNQVNGNWKPFLLKDPVFLMAYISKTPFLKIHTLYLSSCSKLEQLLKQEVINLELATSFNQLFDQVLRIFFRIDQWMGYMQKTAEKYTLSEYVIYQVQNNFSPYFWALRDLQQDMYNSQVIPGIAPPPYFLPDSFSDPVWMTNKEKQPYWEILGLKQTITDNTPTDFYNGITLVANKLFTFFYTIIHNSADEFKTLKLRRSHFPDTTLLRTFVDLMKIYQEELNGLSEKHLEFYYQDILKQSKLPAGADNAFVYGTLAKPDLPFVLPQNTQLNAGLDAQKNPIVFQTLEEVTLNPANITGAYTLTALQGSDNRYSLYLNTLPDPGVVNKDKDGKIEKWQTFGGSKYTPVVQTNMGFAFASPMLFLCEGVRNISININFEETIDMALLQKAKYYLSTPKAWLDVTAFTTSSPNSSDPTAANISIALDATQPAIQAFVQNPDGITNPWPMLKMEFASIGNPALVVPKNLAPPPGSPSIFPLSDPPLMKKMQVEVTVQGLQTFQLYNDYGGLSTKTPFPLFGPTPMPMNSFIIGNAEIFSKPFSALTIELDWDKLPPDLSVYYQQYNDYLLWKSQQGQSSGFCAWVKSWWPFGKKSSTPSTSNSSGSGSSSQIEVLVQTFNNFSHTTSFELLSGNNWNSFDMNKQNACTVSANGIACTPYSIAQNCTNLTTDVLNYLFTSGPSSTPGNKDCVLQGSSVFAYTDGVSSTFVPNPTIQNTALKFSDTSTDGFMKMYLTGIEYGFGSDLYAAVVNYIALQNANSLVHPPSGGPAFIAPANVPFAPKVSQFTASYSASQEYTFDYGQSAYPIQCYFYTPFENYLVYDNTQNASNYSTHIGTSITSPQKVRDGVPLFAFMDYQGILFLEMDNLVEADSINLYFELARKYVTNATQTSAPDYFYLGEKGWEQLKVLADGTNDLACSGIVKLSGPTDPDNTGFMMPAGKYWLSVAVKDQPDAYAETFFLKTNGFVAQRTGTNYLADTTAPTLAAGSITKPMTAIPQVSAFAQPFASFGGTAAETGTVMNQRVSNRIKTKDRVVSREDYFRLVCEAFPEIYYVKTIPGTSPRDIQVLLVEAVDDWTDPSAFMPMVSECTEDKIKKFLSDRASAFTQLTISNFSFLYVQATVSISIKTGYEFLSVQKATTQGINIFMSPWIQASQPQVPIDQGITHVQVADFVKTIPGVDQVESVSLAAFTIDSKTGEKIPVPGDGSSVVPATPNILLVPYTYQIINQATT